MINVVLILLVVLFALGGIRAVLKRAKGESCCSGGASEVKIEPADKNKKNYRYSASCGIGGMKCKNCAARIQNALNSLDGTFAKVDFKKKHAEILLKSENAEETVRKSVSGLGYSLESYSESEI